VDSWRPGPDRKEGTRDQTDQGGGKKRPGPPARIGGGRGTCGLRGGRNCAGGGGASENGSWKNATSCRKKGQRYYTRRGGGKKKGGQGKSKVKPEKMAKSGGTGVHRRWNTWETSGDTYPQVKGGRGGKGRRGMLTELVGRPEELYGPVHKTKPECLMFCTVWKSGHKGGVAQKGELKGKRCGDRGTNRQFRGALGTPI